MARRSLNESGKNKAAYIAFATLSVLSLLCCFLIYYLKTTRGNTHYITLTEKGIENEILEVDFGTLQQGESREYSLHFHCQDAGEYRFTFSYVSANVSALANYLTVEIERAEERKASANLGELLAGETLVVQYSLQKSEKTDILVRYVMAEDLGDDAQGAGLDFDLRLSVEKIG